MAERVAVTWDQARVRSPKQPPNSSNDLPSGSPHHLICMDIEPDIQVWGKDDPGRAADCESCCMPKRNIREQGQRWSAEPCCFCGSDRMDFSVRHELALNGNDRKALVQPGITAEVKVDPQKPQRVQILALDIDQQPNQDAVTRMEELNALRDKNLITESEYQQKREEILKHL